jgi:hypothetical protein
MNKMVFVGLIVSAGMIGMSAMAEMLVKTETSSQAIKPEPVRPTEKLALFNGKSFDGWTKVIKAEKDADPDKTWKIEEGLIKCSGTPYGYLRTQQSYADYKLHVEYRWADMTTKSPNSGIFLFTTGPDNFFLPKAIEAQLKMGSAGDWVMLSTATLNGLENKGTKSVKRQAVEGSEKPRGEWNSVDIIAKGKTIEVSVNGVLMNKGVDVYADAGQICLQSEGGAIDFRVVTIEPIEKKASVK